LASFEKGDTRMHLYKIWFIGKNKVRQPEVEVTKTWKYRREKYERDKW